MFTCTDLFALLGLIDRSRQSFVKVTTLADVGTKNVRHVRRRDGVCKRISLYTHYWRRWISSMTRQKRAGASARMHAIKMSERAGERVNGGGRGVNAQCCSTNLLFIISRFSSFHNSAEVTRFVPHIASSKRIVLVIGVFALVSEAFIHGGANVEGFLFQQLGPVFSL